MATNVELGGDQEGNDDRNLCRFELFEILIRMARYKFIDSQKCTTYAEAFSLMIEVLVTPSVNKLHEWQTFRDRRLWTLEVNDLMEANLSSLQKLYNFVGDGVKKGQKVTYKQAITFLTKTTENVLKLSAQQANIVYTLCK